jgi:hypothetical protein
MYFMKEKQGRKQLFSIGTMKIYLKIIIFQFLKTLINLPECILFNFYMNTFKKSCFLFVITVLSFSSINNFNF